MPNPIGLDRVEEAAEGGYWLSSAAPKGWFAKRARTPTSAEHPGTCVDWDGDLFEVLEIVEEPAVIRYRLAAWAEEQTIRVRARYDEATEREREATDRDRAARARRKRLLVLAAPMTGLAPGRVQERWEREYGTPRVAPTIVSATFPFAAGFYCAFSLVAGAAGGAVSALPVPVLVAGSYFFVESGVRFAVAMSSGRPIGSILGELAFAFERSEAAPPSAAVSLAERFDDEEAPHVRLHDEYLVREPLLAFLSGAEQRLAAERFGFDWRRWGRITAVGLLLLGLVQVVFSGTSLAAPSGDFGDIPPLLLGALLAVEQIRRLATLARDEPAPSVLAFLARPLCRRLLA